MIKFSFKRANSVFLFLINSSWLIKALSLISKLSFSAISSSVSFWYWFIWFCNSSSFKVSCIFNVSTFFNCSAICCFDSSSCSLNKASSVFFFLIASNCSTRLASSSPRDSLIALRLLFARVNCSFAIASSVFFFLIASNCSTRLASSSPRDSLIATKFSFNFLTISNCSAVSSCDNASCSFIEFNCSILTAKALLIRSPNPLVSREVISIPS